MKLFQWSVFEQIRAEGVFVHVSTADAVDLNGKLYAEIGNNLYAADGPPVWHESEAAAREEAASKISAMAAALTAQAVRIRNGGR
jgi:hypothetical protein